MNILSIDPGTSQSGWCILSDRMELLDFGITNNKQLVACIQHNTLGFKKVQYDKLAVEMIASYGQAVGKDVFETCVWIGRFIQAWRVPEQVVIIYRKTVVMHLCGTPRANDSHVRQAIIDLYEPIGGGATPQIGVKDKPGPLYGVNSHIWPAIGVGLVAHHQGGKLRLPDTLPLYQATKEEMAYAKGVGDEL